MKQKIEWRLIMTLIEKLELEKEWWHDDGENNAHRIIDDCIDIVKQHSEWISVDERLPSVNLKVLVWHSRKEKFFTATYDRDLKIWLENGLPYSSNFLYSITHWCELPQPPSEVQGDM